MNFLKRFNEERKRKADEKSKLLKESISKREKDLEEKNKINKKKADSWSDYIIGKLTEHRYSLFEGRQRDGVVDEYGNLKNEFIDIDEFFLLEDEISFEECFRRKSFTKGFNYFFKSVIMKDISINDFLRGWESYKEFYKPKNEDGLDENWNRLILAFWYPKYALKAVVNEIVEKSENRKKNGISPETDSEAYIEYCGDILARGGWETEFTVLFNEKSIHLIGRMNTSKVCFRFSNSQEEVEREEIEGISKGIKFFKADIGVCVSNSGFTNSAESYAKKKNIFLLNEDRLIEMENYF